MPNPFDMERQGISMLRSSVFITFPGNCKAALTFYQGCFGGMLHFELFEKALDDFAAAPVIIGSLISERIIIHGSDLVHDEGRRIGNHISIFLPCKNVHERKAFEEKLAVSSGLLKAKDHETQGLIEVTDLFQVNWILGLR